ncbi:MAG: aspartate ammonia-lyase [Thermoplasmata archaeon]|nr:MAG: aspartate ammonia-lyase [Thermoplasmata archaeon]
MTRKEKDALGEMEIDDDVYYGIQTARAVNNFPVSGIRERPEFVHAYLLLKKSAAQANIELEVLDFKRGEAIIKAAEEALEGRFDDQFVVDVFQAGAGTSFNMNVNEVIANRALEILGKDKGDYNYLSPNDHVNMAQSSNDTFPTASHIAVINSADKLIETLQELAEAFERKSGEFKDIAKSGRTHLMDAVPVTLGQEFGAYASAINRAIDRIKQRRDDLLELPIGGTAAGTGTNTAAGFRKLVILKLSESSSIQFIETRDSFEVLQSRSQLSAFSSALKELALELIRIANDLRLLGSGPTSGISELSLPAVQPGSSIMPGKVNPVMPECLDMVAFQIVGSDTTVALASQSGQLELNVMTPVITHNILQSIAILNNYLPVFTKSCIEGIEANEDECRKKLENNPMLGTLLNPRIGYLKAAELVKESLEKNIPIQKLAVEKGILSAEEAEKLFDVEKISKSIYE